MIGSGEIADFPQIGEPSQPISRRLAIATLLTSAGVLFSLDHARSWYNRSAWQEQTQDQPPFSIRDSARGFVFQDKLWLAGGYMVGNVPRRDLLVSDDGFNWEMVSTATPYAAYSPVTAHKERIVATYPRLLSSSDGLNWRQEENKGDLPPLAAEKPILSFNDNLVLLSGAFSYVHDGKRWTKVETPFRGWLAFSAIVHNGRIIVAGGATRKPSSEQGYSNYTSQNEVWTSNDPLDPGSWVQLSASAEWSARMWPALIVHRDQLYLIGGYENSAGENVADIWRSNHGAHWDEVSTRNNPPSRHAPTVFSCNGKIILLAGNTNDGTRVQNDIWAIDI